MKAEMLGLVEVSAAVGTGNVVAVDVVELELWAGELFGSSLFF